MRLIKQSFFEIIINYEVKDLQKVLMFQKTIWYIDNLRFA